MMRASAPCRAVASSLRGRAACVTGVSLAAPRTAARGGSILNAPACQPPASLASSPALAPGAARQLRCFASPPGTDAAAQVAVQQQQQPSWQIKMLYDGECPLCEREVDFLRSRNAKGAIEFVDIAADDYSPANNAGISFEQAMGTIHAITADGQVVTGVEVFRRLYEAVGLGWVYAATKNPTVEKLANAVYGVWAKYRLQVTGRPGLEVVLQARSKRLCRDGGAAAAE